MSNIIKPLVTEKMTGITEKQNKYGFIVRPQANKIELKKEIEARYNVTVTDINTCIYAGKNKSRYTYQGQYQLFQKGYRYSERGRSN